MIHITPLNNTPHTRKVFILYLIIGALIVFFVARSGRAQVVGGTTAGVITGAPPAAKSN